MANILVYIELRERMPTGASMFALSEARRVSRAAGSTVFAMVTVDVIAPEGLDGLAEILGRGGADKVLLCQAPGLGAPPLDAVHGHSLAAAAERVPPTLIFIPAGRVAAELGPPLAARLGAAYAPGADVEIVSEDVPGGGSVRVRLRRWRAAGDAYRVLDPLELERPVVATLGCGRAAPGRGGGDIEVVMVPCATVADVPVVEVGSDADPEADMERAHALLLLPEGAPAPACTSDVAAVSASTLTRAAAQIAMPALVLGEEAPLVRGTPRTVSAVPVQRLEDVSQAAGDVVWYSDGPPDWQAAASLLAGGGTDGRSE